VIEEHYKRCDATVGQVLAAADDTTLVIVLSDHGFGSFRRGMNLNAWLHQQGLLRLVDGANPGPETGDFFHNVDWSRTQAYALGLGGIYVNQAGREEQGIVSPDDAPALKQRIAHALAGLEDRACADVAVRSVSCREQVYDGAFADEAPDLLVNFNRGYRASWGTALGGVQSDVFEDNTRAWSGDHIIDPDLVPGVLFANRPLAKRVAKRGLAPDGCLSPFRDDALNRRPALIDLAPTILHAFDVPVPCTHSGLPALEGESLLA
jgi:predicted AlkP superfamily phosphohydrolase/phosphomutase